jgi:two-component system sensor histidine kinase PilS (NtrC family)
VRNPLGAISHASQLLSESVTATDDDKRMIEIILAHSNRVNLIIEDILDVSRHDDTEADLIDLDTWLAGFIENYKFTHELCDDIKIEIVNPKAKIKVIKGHLEQVLNNLFDNGLRYSHKKSGSATLLVQAGIESKDGDELPFLHIVDEGPGINEDEEIHLFEPFHTTDSIGIAIHIDKDYPPGRPTRRITI